MKKDDKVIFHNTRLLLEHYRNVVWSLEVSVFQTNVNFQAEFGNTIEEFLELSYEAGLDLPASDVAVALLREKYRNGEECYWVLYYTYLSSQEFGGVDEIVEKLSEMFRDFSRSTYYRRKNESIRRMGDLLWGFRTSCCDPALELLYAEQLIFGRCEDDFKSHR